MRRNKYKEQIVSILNKAHLLSIGEIHKRLKAADYSTVYRNVEQLAQGGVIKKVVLDKDRVLYELCSDHNHFSCISCDVVDEIEQPVRTSFKDRIVTDILVRGLCGSCKE